MEDPILIENRGAYVFVQVSGEYSLQIVLTAIDRVEEAYQQQAFKKILYDFRPLRGKVSVMDRLKIGQYAARFSGLGIKYAALNQEEQILRDKFLENFLTNRGTHFKVFSDEDQALAWLLG